MLGMFSRSQSLLDDLYIRHISFQSIILIHYLRCLFDLSFLPLWLAHSIPISCLDRLYSTIWYFHYFHCLDFCRNYFLNRMKDSFQVYKSVSEEFKMPMLGKFFHLESLLDTLCIRRTSFRSITLIHYLLQTPQWLLKLIPLMQLPSFDWNESSQKWVHLLQFILLPQPMNALQISWKTCSSSCPFSCF